MRVVKAILIQFVEQLGSTDGLNRPGHTRATDRKMRLIFLLAHRSYNGSLRSDELLICAISYYMSVINIT